MYLVNFSKRASDFIDAADDNGNIRKNRNMLNYVRQIDGAVREAGITTGAVYIFAGDNTGDKSESFKFNILNPSMRILSFNEVIFTNTGIEGNGLNSFVNTGLKINELSGINITVYNNKNTNLFGLDIGTQYLDSSGDSNPYNKGSYLRLSSGNQGVRFCHVDSNSIPENNINRKFYTQANSTGLYSANRITNQNSFLYKNTTLLSQVNEARVPGNGDGIYNDIYLLATNELGTAKYFSDRLLSFVSITNAFQDNQKLLVYNHNIMTALRSIGRGV